MAVYVTPVPPALRGQMTAGRCLYAYPAVPETEPPGLILDSGAFGLSQRGGRITPAYMRRLAAHYRQHGGGAGWPRVAVAPDEFLSPANTVANWRHWQQQGYPPCGVVIQSDRLHGWRPLAVRLQCQAYRSAAPAWVGVSNPGLRGAMLRAAGMRVVLDTLRELLSGAWLHVLGAGWDAADLAAWARCGGYDSLDSIAYYTAALAGAAWDGQPPADDWRTTARRNAAYARALLEAA